MDTLTSERRSELMRRIGSKDTRPEMIVRSTLHRMGYRFRLHRRELPGSPDVVLPKLNTAIFVHGCFWHGCPHCEKGARTPKTNREFWQAKVAENKMRDERVEASLAASGWRVLTMWECKTRDREKLKELLSAALPARTRR